MQAIHSSIRDVTSGKNVKIIMPSNLYECVLEDDVFVGPFCEVQSNVRIGRKTRVQSHSFICSCVNIGEECFIGHGVMFINDRFSLGAPSVDSALWESTKIGNRVSIGSNATILPVSICDDVVIGAGAVVTKPISKSGFYVGNPARFLRPLPADNSNPAESNPSPRAR